MHAGLEYLFWSVLCVIGATVWIAYEITQFHRRYTRRHTLRAPERQCVTDRQIPMWMGRR